LTCLSIRFEFDAPTVLLFVRLDGYVPSRCVRSHDIEV